MQRTLRSPPQTSEFAWVAACTAKTMWGERSADIGGHPERHQNCADAGRHLKCHAKCHPTAARPHVGDCRRPVGRPGRSALSRVRPNSGARLDHEPWRESLMIRAGGTGSVRVGSPGQARTYVYDGSIRRYREQIMAASRHRFWRSGNLTRPWRDQRVRPIQ